ncbi:MAG: DNA-directed RNA polymerase subunit alpha [Dehalococcoidales bacterium]|nr:DNA-directed RNA polymerase subunit alpha [Dehalococcoidales bacterium]
MTLSVVPKIQVVETRENFARFVIEPLENGFGITLGNALRRVMLGHLPGAAITRVKIDGISHEFSPIPNVKEDVIEFLLNVKAIRLKPITNIPAKLILDVNSEGKVSAADIKPSADFEITNPELYLATLSSSDAKLYVEFDVEIGSGFRQAEAADNLPVGVIPIDAIFTPTRKVNYSIEPVHVGREVNLERLYLEVWTDGTIESADVLSQSAKMLDELLIPFTSFGKATEAPLEKVVADHSIPDELYNMPVEQLNLSVRTMNCLRRGNIQTVGEIVTKGEKGLMTLRNFGVKSLLELADRMGELGLSLLQPGEKSALTADGGTETEADTETET